MNKCSGLLVWVMIVGVYSASCSDPTDRPTFAAHTKQGATSDSNSMGYSGGEENEEKVPSTTQPAGGETIVKAPSTQVEPIPTKVPTVPAGTDPTTPVVVPDAAKDKCKTFSWESISSPEDALCFKSIDEVFASIPERARSNFVLVHTTRSAQVASVNKPRVIVNSPDGSFIVAAATDQSASKDLEIAVFDYKKNVWNFAGIDFSQNPPKVETMLCKSCHGNEPHPIWTEYPNWPSAFAGVTQKLTDAEAAVMNDIASKKSALPFVKHLVTRSSYKSGSILYPASKYSGSENNQTLNIVIAIKAARSLVGKLYEANTSESDLIKVAAEQMCGSRSGITAKLGFKTSKELNHGIVGQDREQVIWSGNAEGSYFVGIEILNQVFKRNPDIKSSMPRIASLVERKEFKFYRTENLKEFFAAEDDLKGSWQAVDNGWFRGTFRSALKSGTEYCAELTK